MLDRSDAADLLNLVRDELGLSEQARRFPKKATCLAIYSYAVNAQTGLEPVLQKAFPWCQEWQAELKRLFAGYVDAKQRQQVLDYDDLLLYWSRMMAVPAIAEDIGRRFDFVLVDEYQDTNALQAKILLGLKPDGRGLTVVGDDAQSIYGFRAATVRNILDFPGAFEPPAAIVKLEQNYRSTQPILDAANAVMAAAREGFTKSLFSARRSEQKPHLAMVADPTGEVDYVVRSVLANREAGIQLREQAVLFRTAHHSGQLEVELRRRNIPFVKYGGLKFLELGARQGPAGAAALGREPARPDRRLPFAAAAARDRPRHRAQGAGRSSRRRGSASRRSRASRPPRAAAHLWPELVALLQALAGREIWAGQLDAGAPLL